MTHGITTAALYTFDYRNLLEWIEQQSNEGSSLALIGHNPALTELIGFDILVWPAAAAGWAELAIDVDSWSAIRLARGHGELVTNLLPRTLKEAH